MDFNAMMQQVSKMQDKMKTVQDDLALKRIEGSAGGGMVRSIVNGNGELIDISIEKELFSGDEYEMLQDLIKASVNDAISKSKELRKKELGQLAGGLDIPGMGMI